MFFPENRQTSETVLIGLSIVALAGCSKSLTTRPDSGQDAGGSDSGQGTDGGILVIAGTGGLTGKGGAGTGGAAGFGGMMGLGGGMGTGGATGAATGGSTGGTSGRGTGGATGMGGGAGAGVLFQPLVDSFCKAAKTCCAGEFPTSGLTNCEADFPSQLSTYAFVDKGTVTVDQVKLAACIAAYEEAATTCTISKVYLACTNTGIFDGTLPAGESCGDNSSSSNRYSGAVECKKTGGSAACLWTSSQDATGVCVELPHGKEGDECMSSCAIGENCTSSIIGGSVPLTPICFEEDGLYCAYRLDPAVCKPIRQLEQACTSDTNACGTGFFCDWTTNTCQVEKKLGESCKNSACPSHLKCDGTTCVELPFASEYVCKGRPPAPY